ncbi:MAG TPA: O-antigen ligase family protein [Opitutus sp.]|nr:O-antigen ligase family protein [Opitutus sp.]
MKWWAQAVSLALAVLGFAVALVPRNYSEEFTTGTRFRLVIWPRLLRFPIFWAGLALLAYIAVQGLNPAWTYVSNARGWWMQSRAHITWLPSGVDGPFFFGGGPWRTLIDYASPWLVVCSLWIGFSRRRTVQYLLIALSINGLALALFALTQRLTGARRIYWALPSPNPAFFGPFVYKNHAGAYLLLVLALSFALASWYFLRGLRRLEKSNPAGLFVFFGAVAAVDIMISYARGATITMVAFLAVAMISFVFYQFRHPTLLRKPIVLALLLVGFGAFLVTSLQTLAVNHAWNRMQKLFDETDLSISSRELATAATWKMVQDHPWLGAGAGSFRYLFPRYQQHYPEIYREGRQRLFWENAHNDLVQFPAELGIAGCAIFAFGFGFWAWRLCRAYFWENPLSLLVTAGLLLLVAHSWTDFLFENPAVLITWCALWPCITLWAESEEMRLRG